MSHWTQPKRIDRDKKRDLINRNFLFNWKKERQNEQFLIFLSKDHYYFIQCNQSFEETMDWINVEYDT